AQESRRILDRLFGYELSPLLWRKVASGLSAGRVQSPAVRLCVMRERERMAFRAAGYWDAEAEFTKDSRSFTARLSRIDGTKVATGKDFDPDTGALKKRSKALWLKEEGAKSLVAGLDAQPFAVTSLEEKPVKRRPAPPFMTSSLQQEANRKLGMSARNTMRVAQRLYEGVNGLDGLITYHRTDSTTLSKKALGEAERTIRKLYGEDYTDGWRFYATKAKNAQEAHEAIRPTNVARTPDSLAGRLKSEELRVYELIWKRMIASQMTDARLLRTTVELTAKESGGEEREAVFTATGQSIDFPGFLRAYVEGSDDPDAKMADREVILPSLAIDESLRPDSLEACGHETSPPAR
ncbi:MAG: DNA topoisomerase, partial [Gemmatimonadota bacterium]|nr:DNA topoisomerase [Gemmatimonadota bacterium]